MRVCARCIAQFGFRVSDKEKTFETDEEYYDHMENVHGAFVLREGETEQQAGERCAKKGIVADRAICQCDECKIFRGEKSSVCQCEYYPCDMDNNADYCPIRGREEKCLKLLWQKFLFH